MDAAETSLLVAPDAVLYIVPDEAALKRVARARNLDSVLVGNLRQLLRWTPPAAGRTKMLLGKGRHLDGWNVVDPPGAAQHLEDGSSLIGFVAGLAHPMATADAHEVCHTSCPLRAPM